MAVRTSVRALLVAVLGLHMVAAAPALAKEKKKDPPKAAMIGIDPVIEERTSQTVPVIGRLVAQRSGVVSVLTKGVVASVLVRVGDRVPAGDIMAGLLANSLPWARPLRAAAVARPTASLATPQPQHTRRQP